MVPIPAIFPYSMMITRRQLSNEVRGDKDQRRQLWNSHKSCSERASIELVGSSG